MARFLAGFSTQFGDFRGDCCLGKQAWSPQPGHQQSLLKWQFWLESRWHEQIGAKQVTIQLCCKFAEAVSPENAWFGLHVHPGVAALIHTIWPGFNNAGRQQWSPSWFVLVQELWLTFSVHGKFSLCFLLICFIQYAPWRLFLVLVLGLDVHMFDSAVVVVGGGGFILLLITWTPCLLAFVQTPATSATTLYTYLYSDSLSNE